MEKARSFRCSILALGAVLAIAGAGRAANLLTNSAFTTNASPWRQDGFGPAVFDSRDAAGSSHSGSTKITDIFDETTIATVSQCVAIDPNVHYRFRADVLLPTAQPGAIAVALLNRWPSSDCSGAQANNTGVTLVNFVSARDEWQRIVNDNAFANLSGTHSVEVRVGIERLDPGNAPIAAYVDNVVLEPGDATGPCVPDNEDLCLSDFRFRVQASFQTSSGSGTAHSRQLSGDAGVFTFFDPNNVEVQLKVLNACPFAHRYWVFASGTTNVGVDITVTDTKTGSVKTYHNALDHDFAPILDTDAFATCP